MASVLTFTTYDRLNKVTSMSFQGDDLVDNPTVQAIADALDPILRGVDVKATRAIVTVVDQGAAGPSADNEANRGSKWLFRIQDDTTSQVYTHEIGTADGSTLPSPGSDFLDLGAGVGLALKTAIEAAYRSPDGNSGVLLSVQQVNRALN